MPRSLSSAVLYNAQEPHVCHSSTGRAIMANTMADLNDQQL